MSLAAERRCPRGRGPPSEVGLRRDARLAAARASSARSAGSNPSKIAAGTASSTRPIFFARRASSDLPVRMRSSAGGEPDDARQPRASAPRREDPEPDLGQADLRLLRVGHERGSRRRARARVPPPRQAPSIAATVGYGRFASCSKSACTALDGRRGRPRARRVANSLTSAPAMKMSGLPLRTSRARMRGSRVEPHEHVARAPRSTARRELVDLLAGQIEREDGQAVLLHLELEGRHAGNSSTTAAPPCPPPMHIVARPNCVPRRRISCRSVVTSRFADEPDRVAEGDRAAVDVGALPVDLADRSARAVLRVPRGRRKHASRTRAPAPRRPR